MIDFSPSLLSIDLASLAANYNLLNKGTPAGAAVKANAYGLGIDKVAPVLAAQGCRDFFVATIDEGVHLRKLVTGDIYILNGIHAGAADMRAHNLIPVLNSVKDLEYWTSGPCAIHFDTGMNRLGLSADETKHLIEHQFLLQGRDVKLALSHFACSDELDHPLIALQCQRTDVLQKQFPQFRWSLANSSGIFRARQYLFDLTRPGYALYGGNPTPETKNPMHPVVRLDVRVLQTRDVKKGSTIGYGATHTFPEDAQTATINLGYADGFARANKGHVFWQGQPCPILGRISMDSLSIGIGHLQGPKPAAGDLIEVLGPHQGIDALAEDAGTIGYEVLTSLGMRYARHYIDAP